MVLSVVQNSWMERFIWSRRSSGCCCAQLSSCTLQYFGQRVLLRDRFLRSYDILDHKGFLEIKGQENEYR